MAPESPPPQALLLRRDQKPADSYTFKVDYWALGCLVYELIAGEP